MRTLTPCRLAGFYAFSHRRFFLRFLEVSTAAGSVIKRTLVDRHVLMEDSANQGPRRHLIAPLSTVFLLRLQSQRTHVDWCSTNQELECLYAAAEDGDNANEEYFEFDEGDDLECDLAAALSSDDRKAADEKLRTVLILRSTPHRSVLLD